MGNASATCTPSARSGSITGSRERAGSVAPTISRRQNSCSRGPSKGWSRHPSHGRMSTNPRSMWSTATARAIASSCPRPRTLRNRRLAWVSSISTSSGRPPAVLQWRRPSSRSPPEYAGWSVALPPQRRVQGGEPRRVAGVYDLLRRVGVEVGRGLDAQDERRATRLRQLERAADVAVGDDGVVGARRKAEPAASAGLVHDAHLLAFHRHRVRRAHPDAREAGDAELRFDPKIHITSRRGAGLLDKGALTCGAGDRLSRPARIP